MRALILTSNSPRHEYLCRSISNHFKLVGVISEKKGDYYGKQRDSSELIQTHFDNLLRYETNTFSSYSDSLFERIEVERSNINNHELVLWAENKDPDIVILFGTGILNDLWLSKFKDKIINIHLGYSPYYKGSATLFWPFVYNELDKIGVTIHLAVKEVDAGAILDTVTREIEDGENYYDITTKLIKKALDLVPHIALKYLNAEIEGKSQTGMTGRTFRKKDFNESVLRKALFNANVGLR